MGLARETVSWCGICVRCQEGKIEECYFPLKMKLLDEFNPKDKIGAEKVNLGTIPVEVLCEVSNGLLEGEIKYTAVNWRNTKVRGRIYYEAALRHLLQWYGGEDIDSKSGLSHITKAICSLFVLRDAMIHEMWIDDRPIGKKNFDWLSKYNTQVVEIKKRLKEAN